MIRAIEILWPHPPYSGQPVQYSHGADWRPPSGGRLYKRPQTRRDHGEEKCLTCAVWASYKLFQICTRRSQSGLDYSSPSVCRVREYFRGYRMWWRGLICGFQKLSPVMRRSWIYCSRPMSSLNDRTLFPMIHRSVVNLQMKSVQKIKSGCRLVYLSFKKKGGTFERNIATFWG